MIKNFFKKNKLILIILTLTIILRVPSLFEPNHYADEDIYLTLGQGLKKGLVFYRDIHDNKPPLLYITAAIASNVPTFRLILLFWNLINVYFIWLISQKLFKKHSYRFISTCLFAIFSSIPLTEGNIANGEIFMIMPTTIAVYLLLSKSHYFLSGLLFAVAFLFKVPVVFEFATIVFWLTFYQHKKLKKGFRNIFSLPVISLIVGFFLPIVTSIVYYYSISSGQPYVQAALLQNVGYLSSWQARSQPFYQSGLFIRAVITLIFMSLIFFNRRRLDNKFGFISCWFVGALFGALLSGRPYPHYFIEILPPAVFLVTYRLIKKNQLISTFSSLLIFLTIFSLFYYNFWYYKSLPYYKNFIQYSLGKIDKKTFYRFWGDSVITNYQVAKYVQDRTQPDQSIFVWGTQPAIYAISNRLPVGRYTVSYHIADFDGYLDTITKLKMDLPKFIIYANTPGENFDQLDDLVSKYYFLDNQIDTVLVYQKR